MCLVAFTVKGGGDADNCSPVFYLPDHVNKTLSVV